ncbi:hypothetical protein SDC9_127159 [bioreactor metagenome]|uniref:Uncharacterized protein n=1 Tax=bioreactor metagenome TaxID=1076179 RepID=A0A645CT55_9ZZZZ
MFSKEQIEELILRIIIETDVQNIKEVGKNVYITSVENNIMITINSNTCRVITVDRITKTID